MLILERIIKNYKEKIIKIVNKKLPFKVINNGLLKKISFLGFEIPYQTLKIGILRIIVPFGYFIKKSNIKLNNYNQKDKLENIEYKKELLSSIYQRRVGKIPNLENPKLFTEKINYLKLYYHDELITTCCDKFAVKSYIEEVLGKKYVIPNIAVWKDSSEINFDELPNSFVLKVNWSSGYNILIADKKRISVLEKKLIKRQLNYWLKPESNSYYDSFNWGYKNVKPLVYAEEYLDIPDEHDEYKLFCFNGKVKFALIENFDHNVNNRVCVDVEGKELEFCFGYQDKISVNIDYRYEEMIRLAEQLAMPFLFVRIDFLVNKNQIYVGEMTFYSGGGFSYIHPQEWNKKLGDLIDL